MIDKKALRKRLDMMLHLPVDWDGYGTEPINQKVYEISCQLLDYVSDSIFGLQIFVGVQTEGSLYAEFDLNRKRIEMTITPDGVLYFDEFIADQYCGSDSFYLDKDKLQSLLDS